MSIGSTHSSARHRRVARHRTCHRRGPAWPVARQWRSPAPTKGGSRRRVPPCPRLAAGSRVLALRADVRVEADVVEALTRVVAEWGGLDILVNNAGVGGFVEVADDDVRRLAPGHRDQPHGRLPRLPCGHSPPQGTRRRLDHQRQQSGCQEPVCRRRRVLRVEGGPERIQRGADAGAATRRHSRQRRDARLGPDGLQRRRRRPGAPTGSWRQTTSRRSSSIWSRIPRAACPAASRSVPHVRRGNDTGD